MIPKIQGMCFGNVQENKECNKFLETTHKTVTIYCLIYLFFFLFQHNQCEVRELNKLYIKLHYLFPFPLFNATLTWMKNRFNRTDVMWSSWLLNPSSLALGWLLFWFGIPLYIFGKIFLV